MTRLLRRLAKALWLVTGTVALAAFARVRPHRWIPPVLSLRFLRAYFEPGAAAVAAGMRASLPDGGRVVHSDLSYGPGRDGAFDLVLPADAGEPRPVVVWLHGGGYYYGSKSDPLPYLELLARRGFAAVSLNYPRIPEHRFPAAPQAVLEAIAHLADHAADYRIDATRIVLAGDSAGAQLAASAALACVDPGYAARLGTSSPVSPETIRGAALFCGTYDAEALLRADRVFTAILASSMWAMSGRRDWVGTEAADLMTIKAHATAAYPPTFLRAGNADPLTAEGTVPMAARLAELGVELDSEVVGTEAAPEPHEFQFRIGSPEADRALEELCAFLDRVTA